MKKKLLLALILLSAFISVFALFTYCVGAENTPDIAHGELENGLFWEIDSNGTFTLTGTGKMRFEGYRAPWYEYRQSIKKAVIGEGITYINHLSFYGCSEITEISLPSTVRFIGESAFEKCRALKKIELPEGITYIGEAAFYNCTRLEGIVIPSTVEDISTALFNGCTSLSSVTIKGSPRQIKAFAFYRCSSLTGISVPEGITTIREHAFEECTSLISLSLPSTLKTVGEFAFAKCTSITTLDIPKNVTLIDAYAFDSCSAISSITLPKSLKTINKFAFYGCSSLKEITLPKSIGVIGENVFGNCKNLNKIYVNTQSLPKGYDDLWLGNGEKNISVFFTVPDENVKTTDDEKNVCTLGSIIKRQKGINRCRFIKKQWCFEESKNILLNSPKNDIEHLKGSPFYVDRIYRENLTLENLTSVNLGLWADFIK